ncbi:MAG: cohesin domain-containing protein, partial [bacterium]|nr:cohesin domain-containing protein [bacterium]
MKKKITIILLVVTALVLSCQMAFATTSPVLRCKTENATVSSGETITVTVEVSDPLTFKSMLLKPVYDSNVFELVSGEWNAPDAVIADVDMSQGKAAIAFASETTFVNGMFSFVLKVKETATNGSTQIKVDHVIKNGTEEIFCGDG